MDYTETTYFKALNHLVGKDDVTIDEYKEFLLKSLGHRWLKTYDELDNKGFIIFKSRMTGNDAPIQYQKPEIVVITETGNLWLEALVKKIDKEFDELKSTESRTKWTKATGKMTIVILIIAAITLYYTYLLYHNEKSPTTQSKAPTNTKDSTVKTN